MVRNGSGVEAKVKALGFEVTVRWEVSVPALALEVAVAWTYER